MFGDTVTPAQWSDIWLNEGFATYTEWLYTEQDGGKTVQQMFDAAYRSSTTVWKGKVAKPGRDHIFDPLTYIRSGMTLHQLRRTIGDAAFFQLVKEWPKTERNGNATTTQHEEERPPAPPKVALHRRQAQLVEPAPVTAQATRTGTCRSGLSCRCRSPAGVGARRIAGHPPELGQPLVDAEQAGAEGVLDVLAILWLDHGEPDVEIGIGVIG